MFILMVLDHVLSASRRSTNVNAHINSLGYSTNST